MIFRKLTIASMLLLLCHFTAGAASMDITASFSPSVERPNDNVFTNTTPQSGFCTYFPSECVDKSRVSIALPLTYKTIRTIPANGSMREGVFVHLPRRQYVTLTNRDGDTMIAEFIPNFFSARITPHGGINTWGGGGLGQTLGYPQNSGGGTGCSSGIGGGYLVQGESLMFAWRANDGTNCYRVSDIERSEGIVFDELSIGYEFRTPNPLTVEAGIYEGEITYQVGPGGDLDFGDNADVSDDTLNVRFRVNVVHELILNTDNSNRDVMLLPCNLNKVCSLEEGNANWERWMINRVTPQLTGGSNFKLSSSGTFTVYLECEHYLESDCALKSDNIPTQLIPVQTLLTLPENIVNSVSGAGVLKQHVFVGKDISKSLFTTKAYGQNKNGRIDFRIVQKYVESMLMTRPDSYTGTVTVIFDPDIH